MPVLNHSALIDERVSALKSAHLKGNIKRATVNLSGGIDSAVVACLAVLALGPDNVTLDHTGMSTNNQQTTRAEDLAQALGCKLAVGKFTYHFNVILEEMKRSLERAGFDPSEIEARCEADPTIEGSIRSIFRTTLGRGYNRLTGGGLYHGTGNECEDRYLRFYQKGGDGEVDSNPIAMLSKGEVYQLAWALGNRMGDAVKAALKPIIEATPSPDLWGVGDEHSDEAELRKCFGVPFTYSRINVDTGEYVKVGTIERVSRFLDCTLVFPGTFTNGEKVLFRDLEPDWTEIAAAAVMQTPCFNGINIDTVEALLRGARKAEAVTRHKLNPNIPAYGDRALLVEDGILTNDLPVLT